MERSIKIIYIILIISQKNKNSSPLFGGSESSWKNKNTNHNKSVSQSSIIYLKEISLTKSFEW